MKKELRKIELTRKGMLDKYNSVEAGVDLSDVEKVLNTSLKFAPQKGDLWAKYVADLCMHVDYADDKNTKVHIENNGRLSWWTHRSPSGCFMCEDVALRHVMLQVLQLMAKKYPKNTF